MNECFYNKFHPTLPQCRNEGKSLPKGEFLQTGNGTDTWTWCAEHSAPFTRDSVERLGADAVPPNQKFACQHDLLVPNPTVTVTSWRSAECDVCASVWELPESTVNPVVKP
jgi:hypothetical protein